MYLCFIFKTIIIQHTDKKVMFKNFDEFENQSIQIRNVILKHT